MGRIKMPPGWKLRCAFGGEGGPPIYMVHDPNDNPQFAIQPDNMIPIESQLKYIHSRAEVWRN